jgi:hypothetical protein
VDDIPQLLRQAQEIDSDTAAGLWDSCKEAWRRATDWHKKAGRALAEEGLATDILRQQIEVWIERERGRLREGSYSHAWRLRRPVGVCKGRNGGAMRYAFRVQSTFLAKVAMDLRKQQIIRNLVTVVHPRVW